MKKDLTEFVIPFSGMKVGNYRYSFKIDNTFFDAFEYSEIKKGDVTVDVDFEKSETMLIFQFSVSGTIEQSCDLCLERINQKIEGEYRQIFKFTDEEDLFLDDEIRHLPFSEFNVDLAPYVVEFINLSKPNRIRHEEGLCNSETLSLLNEYLLVEKELNENEDDKNEVVDPRWEVLKKLKNNNN